jgi:hypothetical protein
MKLTLRDIEGVAKQRNRDKYNTKDCLFALAFAVALVTAVFIGAVNVDSSYKSEGSFVVNSIGTLVLEDGEYPMLNGYKLVSADTKDTKNQPLAIAMFVLCGFIFIGAVWWSYKVDKRWYNYRDKMKQEYMDTGNVPSLEP